MTLGQVRNPLSHPTHARCVHRWFYVWLVLASVLLHSRAWAGQVSTSIKLSIAVNGNTQNTARQGDLVTLSATVTSGVMPVTPGTVLFCDASAAYCTDVHIVGTAQLTTTGTATFRFRPGPGTRSYKAVFAGTATEAASNSNTITLLITESGPIPTTATVAATGAPGNYTLTAKVQNYGTRLPSGQVAFLDTTNGNYSFGQTALQALPSALTFVDVGGPSNSGGDDVAVADFNNDGIPDLATPGDGSAGVRIYLGRGDGSFTVAASLSALPTPPSVVRAGDFNNDGNLDLVVASGSSVYIYLGRGDGTFSAPIQAPATANFTTDLAVADLDNDGNLDIVLGKTVNSTGGSTMPAPNRVTAFLGRGDGTFTRVDSVVSKAPNFLAVGDFNHDGLPDVAAASNGAVTNLTTYLGNGDGTVRGPAYSSNPPETIFQMVSADLDNDGYPDLLYAAQAGTSLTGGVMVGYGLSNGNFLAASEVGLDNLAQSLVVADVDQDGLPDVVAAQEPGYLQIALNQGNRTFRLLDDEPVAPYQPSRIATADFDGDGYPDFAVVGLDPDADIQLTKLVQSANGSLTGVSPVGTGIHYVVVSYSGDNYHAPSVSAPIALTAQRVPTVLTLTVTPATSFVGQSVNLSAQLDKHFAQDHEATGSVTFTANGRLIGTSSVMQGTASITTTTLPAGTDNLQASYSGDINFVGSTSANVSEIVSEPQPQTIRFPQPPTPAYVGTSVQLNATSSSGLPVSYTVLSGPATVSGSTLTYSGVGVVTVEADQAGNVGVSAAPPVQVQISVILRIPVVNLSATPNPVLFGDSVVLSVSVTSPAGTPTGSVTFSDGATVLGTGGIASGIARLTLSNLPLGSHTFVATYNGDSLFGPLTSSAVVVVVQDFSVSVGNPNITISHGGTATYSLVLSSLGGNAFTSSIQFTLTGAPDHSDIAFSPQPLSAINGSVPVLLTIRTPNYPVGPFGANTGQLLTPTFAFLGVLMLPLLRLRGCRNKVSQLCSCVLALGIGTAGCLALSGCGSGWRTQQWTMQATATSGKLSHTAVLTLTSRCQNGQAACPIATQ